MIVAAFVAIVAAALSVGDSRGGATVASFELRRVEVDDLRGEADSSAGG